MAYSNPCANIPEIQFICSPDYVPIPYSTVCLKTEHRKNGAEHESTDSDWAPVLKWLPDSYLMHQFIACFFMANTGTPMPFQRRLCSRHSNAMSGFFRRTEWIDLYSTDMDLSVEQIIEYYGSRWKIESGFKEIKQDIGSSKSLTRTAHAVINHINFFMMATSITWIYGTRLESIPKRWHKVKGPNSFAFPYLRHIIAKAALSNDFNAVCNKQQKLPRKQ